MGVELQPATTTAGLNTGVTAGHGGAAEAAVRCTGAGKCFGQDWVVRNLDLVVPRGAIVGLIGPSGSGKTTTIRLVNGVYRPEEGEVAVFDTHPHRMRARDRTAIGYLPQRPVLFEELSLWQNLNFHASLNGVRLAGRRRRLHELLELVGLTEDRGKLVRQASGGMQRRVALAATLVHRPSLLLLDEPTAGIDPILRQRFWDHFRHLRDDGHTLVVTTQYVGEAARCDLVGLMAEGRLIAFGTPADLRRMAYGGELIEVELDRVPTDDVLAALLRMDGVHGVELVRARRVRLTVGDAGAALVPVAQHLEQLGISVLDAGEVGTDYDDVFIRLVEAAAA